MANHATVKTQTEMTVEQVKDLLAELNKSLFKGLLKFEFDGETTPTWAVVLNGQQIRYFWLNSPTEWEIKHGGGGHFYWWVDFAVTNAIALRFDGVIIDDGDGIEHKGEEGKYDNFGEFVDRMHVHIPDDDVKKALMQLDQEHFTPSEFHLDLGPKIELQIRLG
jgi:hypothetical protein